MRIAERRLRSLLRSLIKEVIEDPDYGTLYDMPDGSVVPAGDQEEIFRSRTRDRETDEFPRPEDEEYSDEFSEEDYFYSEDYAQDMRDRDLTDPYMGDED